MKLENKEYKFKINETVWITPISLVELVEDYVLDKMCLGNFEKLDENHKKIEIMESIYLCFGDWVEQAIEDRDWNFCVFMENDKYKKQREKVYEHIYLLTLEDLKRMYDEGER